jgi:DNA (cytosine-5)-methyltransferase 1
MRQPKSEHDLRGQIDDVVDIRDIRLPWPMASRTTLPDGLVVGLFAGIGGLEAGFQKQGYHPAMLCEADPAARSVLAKRFPDVLITEDIRTLDALPASNIVTAGFPCQDLSQVGRCRGVRGPNSGLVDTLLDLLRLRGRPPKMVDS